MLSCFLYYRVMYYRGIETLSDGWTLLPIPHIAYCSPPAFVLLLLCPPSVPKGLIPLCIVLLAFWIFIVFFIYTRIYDINMLVSKTRVKTQENVSILHYALGKNTCQLRFFSRFSCILLAFCSRFVRVLLTNLTKTQTQCIV